MGREMWDYCKALNKNKSLQNHSSYLSIEVSFNALTLDKCLKYPLVHHLNYFKKAIPIMFYTILFMRH